MSQYIHKSHNVSMLLYHLVCPARYRKVVFDEKVDIILKQICLDISDRYELTFLEIGTDKDHVHFLIQSISNYSPTKIVAMVKSIIAKQVFLRAPYVKRELWGGAFWSSGYSPRKTKSRKRAGVHTTPSTNIPNVAHAA